jgi:CheY-like chemotaxis protein
VARIIHVEDEPHWIDIVRHALADHEVDSARTWGQALALLHGPGTYDLALIDLNLNTGSDAKDGEELLDVLRVDFPAIRRVVITARPPAGDVRSLFQRYGVQDMIIKDKTTLPDLQLVVRRALRQRPDDSAPEANVHASELRARWRDWREALQQEIRAGIRECENLALHSGRTPGRSADDAVELHRAWQAMQQEFAATCERIEGLIAAARTSDDVEVATRELEQAKDAAEAKIRRLQSPGH